MLAGVASPHDGLYAAASERGVQFGHSFRTHLAVVHQPCPYLVSWILRGLTASTSESEPESEVSEDKDEAESRRVDLRGEP
jgi:hypothetical protein